MGAVSEAGSSEGYIILNAVPGLANLMSEGALKSGSSWLQIPLFSTLKFNRSASFKARSILKMMTVFNTVQNGYAVIWVKTSDFR